MAVVIVEASLSDAKDFIREAVTTNLSRVLSPSVIIIDEAIMIDELTLTILFA